MRTRLLVAAVCMFALPVWFTAFTGDKATSLTPFNMVAYAGHTNSGGHCDCGAPGCTCDPGETSGPKRANVPDETKRPVDQEVSSIRVRSGFDLGTGVLMLALALFVWTRLRA